eukprot:980179-Prorocentrum_lima.AAC.1
MPWTPSPLHGVARLPPNSPTNSTRYSPKTRFASVRPSQTSATCIQGSSRLPNEARKAGSS